MQTTTQPDTGALCPSIEDLGPRFPLYTSEFAQNPQAVYTEMRKRGYPLVGVDLAPDIPATLVIGYDTAVRVYHDPVRFPADPREWQRTVPAGHPIRPMTEYRPNPLRSDGTAHGIYRDALLDALKAVDLHSVRAATARAAEPLIKAFSGAGEAELREQYVLPLVLTVLNEEILGCPPDIADRVLPAMAAMFDSTATETVEAELIEAINELFATKRARPADDVTSRLVHNATNLNEVEKYHQMYTLWSAGVEPTSNFLANTLHLALTDPHYQPDSLGFMPPMRDVVNHTLHTNPPMAHYCISYPKSRTLIDGIWLPAHRPVLIGMTAASTDPTKNLPSRRIGEDGWGIGFGLGRHACPSQARSSASLIAEVGASYLLDALPEIELAVPADQLVWRPSPFQRAPAELPVVFPPAALHTTSAPPRR